MIQEEQERLETTLRQIQPAAPPQDLMERLRTAKVEAQSVNRQAQNETLRTFRTFRWMDLIAGWRRLAVALSAATAMVLLCLAFRLAPKSGPTDLSDSSGIKANAVQVGHSLVASFDTVAQLPGGEPVRFRCREWQDDVVVRDDAKGVVISKSTPRVEVVPVRLEIY